MLIVMLFIGALSKWKIDGIKAVWNIRAVIVENLTNNNTDPGKPSTQIK
jgi:isoprenylcysteine carboxyl methyltransferase (ICMT) family protein YpbQ